MLRIRLATRAAWRCGQGRDRTVDLSLFKRALVPTELPGLSKCESPLPCYATPKRRLAAFSSCPI